MLNEIGCQIFGVFERIVEERRDDDVTFEQLRHIDHIECGTTQVFEISKRMTFFVIFFSHLGTMAVFCHHVSELDV